MSVWDTQKNLGHVAFSATTAAPFALGVEWHSRAGCQHCPPALNRHGQAPRHTGQAVRAGWFRPAVKSQGAGARVRRMHYPNSPSTRLNTGKAALAAPKGWGALHFCWRDPAWPN